MKYRSFRPFLLLLLLGGCAGLERALAPAPRPWPIPDDGRINRDGRLLRSFGSSLKSREEADAQARRNLEVWLLRLDLDVELSERRPFVQSLLDLPQAKPVPSQVVQATGFTSVITLDLVSVQNKLRTRYDLPPPAP